MHIHYFQKMQSPKVNLFGIDVDALTMKQSVSLIGDAIESKRQMVHNCINANKVVLMENDSFLRTSLVEADIISADGQAVVWASQLFGRPLPERVPGIDLLENLMKMADQKGYSAFLFGAKEHIVKTVSTHYNKTFNNKIIAGYHNGYFRESDEKNIIQQINDSGAQMLFVAIPSPEKEIFIKKYRKQLPNTLLLMGVGGSFDVISGDIDRAPRWMQNNGLEWLFRLIQEPRKMWRRYLLGNLSYIRITIKAYFSKK